MLIINDSGIVTDSRWKGMNICWSLGPQSGAENFGGEVRGEGCLPGRL